MGRIPLLCVLHLIFDIARVQRKFVKRIDIDPHSFLLSPTHLIKEAGLKCSQVCILGMPIWRSTMGHMWQLLSAFIGVIFYCGYKYNWDQATPVFYILIEELNISSHFRFLMISTHN